MSIGFWQIAVVAILFLLLFGRGKIPQLMSDMAEGIKSFKKGVSDNDTDNAQTDPAPSQQTKPLIQDAQERVAAESQPGRSENEPAQSA